MKKQTNYVSPQVEAVEIKAFGLLCASVPKETSTEGEDDLF